jgi:two-component system, chemotaxis family, protein-glutamate methylesterase/glutaminase
MISVLIVDDSATVRRLLRSIIESNPEMSVAGEARDGLEAVLQAQALNPDVISMDMVMPRCDGLTAIRQIMSESPCPVVVVTSSHSEREYDVTHQAIDAGALAVVRKPSGLTDKDPLAVKMVEMLRIMSGVPVIRRRSFHRPKQVGQDTASYPQAHRFAKPQIIAIGASTGGPPAIQKILLELPADLPVPVLVVQHISLGFVGGFVRWLSDTVKHPVVLARNGQVAENGTVYVAPDSHHLMISRARSIVLSDAPTLDGHRPSVTALFESVAATYRRNGAGVLLTGMGKDGASGLLAILQAGGRTLAQDEKTSIVFGMPGAAVALKATQHVAPLDSIAHHIKRWLELP